MFRYFLAPLMFGVVVTALTVQAQPPAAKAKPGNPMAVPGSSDITSKQILDNEQRLLRQYKAIAEELLTLAHLLEKSKKPEDQDKAKLILKALELGDKEAVEFKFQTLLRTLAGKNGVVSLFDVENAKNQNVQLIAVLKAILDILQSDDELARLKEEKDFLEKRLAELKALIRETKVARTIGESGKGDPKKIADEQKKIGENTDRLAKRLEGKDPNAPESKDGKPKDGMGDMGKPKDGKDGKDGMGGMGKGKDGKDGMGGMGKGKDGKDGKDGMGGMGKGKDGMGGMGGMGKSGMGGDSPPPPPSPQGPKSPGADQVRKAVPDQEDAAKKLEENKRPDAVQKQTDAIEKLQQAQAELEKRLKQLREEELERLLANLEARVAKMLQMQTEVYGATRAIDTIVQKNEAKVPEKPEIQKSQVQADKETEIIGEANKTIEILKSEGSAVAFPRVFEETVIDMTRVRERLNQANVANETQEMEKDIIATLKEMLEALKKAQQDLQQQKAQPPGAGGGPPPDQKLLDEIAELKMIRNLQVRVNDRTKRRGEEIKGKEQAEPQMKVEIKDLANRQVKIEEMARDIAIGKNK